MYNVSMFIVVGICALESIVRLSVLMYHMLLHLSIAKRLLCIETEKKCKKLS